MKIGDIYRENGVAFKVIGVDGEGRYVLTRIIEAEAVKTEEPQEEPVKKTRSKRK
jgi:hypothetical protein